MALTPTERKRRQRQKEKELAKEEARKGGDAIATFVRTPYSEWAKNDPNLDDLNQIAGIAGFQIPDFDNERDPEEFVVDIEAYGDVDLFGEAKGALGRAEATIGILQDLAQLIARSVNEYKQSEIKARLAELESSDTTDRATAINEAVKLNKMLDLLNKRVRKDFPQWKVTGV